MHVCMYSPLDMNWLSLFSAEDFVLMDSVVTFDPDTSNVAVSVVTTDDDIRELTETFQVREHSF